MKTAGLKVVTATIPGSLAVQCVQGLKGLLPIYFMVCKSGLFTHYRGRVILKFINITLCLVLGAVLTSPSTVSAQSGPAEAAAGVFQQFLTAFTNSDAETVVSLFSDEALFWGTGSQTLVEETAGIRQYFSNLEGGTPGQNIASALDYKVHVLSDTDVLVSGMWQIQFGGNANGVPLRVSMAVSQREGQWKIVQFHNSRVPE